MATAVPRTSQEYEAEIAKLRDELKAMEDIATGWWDARNELWWLAGDARALLKEALDGWMEPDLRVRILDHLEKELP